MADAGKLESEGPAEDGDKIVFEHLQTSRGKAAVRGAFWSTLNTLVPTGLTALVFIVTSRYLLPADFGLVALATSVVVFASGFGPNAFGEALIQRRSIRNSHLDTVFWLSFTSAAAIYVILLLITPFLTFVGASDLTALIAVIGLKLFFDLAAVVPNALISRTMSFHLAAVRTTIATVVSAVVSLGLIFAGFGFWAIAFAQIASSIAGCLAAFWGAGWLPGLRIRRASLGDLAHYGTFASANRFLQTMNLDQLIIGTLVNPAALGIYNFARRMLQMISSVVAGGLTSVTHVLLSSLQDDKSRMREAFLMATFGCSLVSFPAFLGLALVASDAIPVIFGPNWDAAIWPVRFFCVIGLMTGIGIIQAALINSQGKTHWWLYYQLGRNLTTILTVFLFYDQGVSMISFLLMAGVLLLWPISLVMTSRLIGLSTVQYFSQFIRPLVAITGMAICIVGTQKLAADMPQAVSLLAQIAGGGCAYCLLIYLLCRRQIEVLLRATISKGIATAR